MGVLCFPAVALAQTPESFSLIPGVPVERPLEPGDSDLFQAELAADAPWLLLVDQRGIDVMVEVRDPAGRSLLRVDNPLGREGTESLLLTPSIPGLHTLEVRSERQGAPEGRYEIRLAELPVATPEDRLRVRAEEAVTVAGRVVVGQEDGATERAVLKLREALDLWRELEQPHREAWTELFLGALYEALDDYRQAALSYGKALTLWRRLGEERGMAAALDRLGLAHNHLGNPARAIAELKEALALRQHLGDAEREAQTRNRLCLAMQRSGRFHGAGRCYEETLAQARALGDVELEATLLNNLGGIASNLGEPAQHFEYLQQSLELRRELGDELGEAIAVQNLGAFHRGLGEVEEALDLYARALAVFERLENRFWQARTLNNVGYAYLTLGELERARAYLLRALSLRREVGDRSGESVTLVNLGRAFSSLGDAGKALACYRGALDHYLEVGNRRGTANVRRLLGDLHLERHETGVARRELELALASVREMGHRHQEAEVLELLSRAHLNLGEPGQAKELAAKALDLHRAVKSPLGEIAALTTLARIERRLGRSEPVRGHLETALDALEALHGRLGDPNQKASFLATQRQVYELYVDFLMELHRRQPTRGYELAALEVSERARSRSLLALVGGTGAGLGREIEPDLAQRLRNAERRFAAKSTRQFEVLGRKHAMEEALAAEQELYEALTEVENMRAEIRRRSPRHDWLSRPQILDASATRALLDDETVLLEIFLAEKRSYAWWVTPDSIAAYELPAREEVEALAQKVHQQLSAIHLRTPSHREAWNALGRMLLGPVGDRLQGQRLVVVADGALHFVPLAALGSPQTGEPLLLRHEVVYLPSASVLAAQRRERAVPRSPKREVKTVAILADPIFDRQDPRIGNGTDRKTESSKAARSGLEELARLPHTRSEAEAIASLVPASQRLLAMGGDARRSRVLGDELAAYRILHFATHGLVHTRAPELSGLVLSRHDAEGRELDGFLGLHDVSSLDLSAELVVLSGCRTALGKHIRGEGLVGLTRGFLYAGVPRVVASFWQVRDQATAELMARFHHALLVENQPAATALRTAQLNLRQERGFRDPYYWAAFSLQGDWR